MLRRTAAGLAGAIVIGGGVVVAAGSPDSTEPPASTVADAAAVEASSSPIGSDYDARPVMAEKADVAAVAVEARAARMAVLVDPDDAALVAALDTLYTAGGEARAEIDGRIASMADEGLTVAPDPDVPDALTVEGVVLAGDRPAAATVTACVVESGIYSHAEAPETSAVEVGRDFRAFRARYAMVVEQGLWKVDTVEFVAEWPGRRPARPATRRDDHHPRPRRRRRSPRRPTRPRDPGGRA